MRALQLKVLAHVACSFSPTDVEDDKATEVSKSGCLDLLRLVHLQVFRDSCLDLSEGDIVEVIAGGTPATETQHAENSSKAARAGSMAELSQPQLKAVMSSKHLKV